MNLQEIPRTAIRTYLQATRLPLTAVERLLGKADDRSWPPAVAWDTFETNFKRVAAALLRDDELAHEAQAGQVRVGELQRAAQLDAMAEVKEAAAEAEYQEDREEIERDRAAVAERDRRRHEVAERQKAEEDRLARQRATERQKQVKKVEDAARQAVTRHERDARLRHLTEEEQALADAQQAAAAKEEVIDLTEEIESSKSARKRALKS